MEPFYDLCDNDDLWEVAGETPEMANLTNSPLEDGLANLLVAMRARNPPDRPTLSQVMVQLQAMLLEDSAVGYSS